MVLVGTQADSEEKRVVSLKDGKERAVLFDCPFFEVSAKSGLNISEMFQEIHSLIVGETKKNRSRSASRVKVKKNRERPSSSWIKAKSHAKVKSNGEFENVKRELGINFPKHDGTDEVQSKLTKSMKLIDFSNPDAEGWLSKEGAIRKSIKRRWLIIKGSVVYYFKNKEQKNPLGNFILSNATIFVNTDRPYSFSVRTVSRTWVFLAQDKENMNDWMRNFEVAMNKELNFGVTMDFVVNRAKKRGYDSPVPIIVQKCVEFLRAKGCIQQEGIFRISGENAAVIELKNAWNEEEDTQFQLDLNLEDIHTVSSALKLYFRELPEPLLTYKLYDEWVATQYMSEVIKRIEMVRQLVTRLPEIHRSTLQFLIAFLREIGENSEQNKMNSSNLSVVFGPTLCRCRKDDPLILFRDMRHQYGCIKDCIDHYEAIFKNNGRRTNVIGSSRGTPNAVT